jgi:hypothetical protein
MFAFMREFTCASKFELKLEFELIKLEIEIGN